MKNKEGLSSIITAVLLVLLTLTVIAVVWGTVSSVIEKSSGQITNTVDCLGVELEILSAKLDTFSNELKVIVKKLLDKKKLLEYALL